jgi:cytochrome c-type biogenesis protein CcmF
VATGILREWVLGTRVRHLKGENYLTAFLGLMAANRPRYGGYIVHLAMVVLAFSVTGSSFYMTQRDFSLLPGEEATVDGYTIRYIGANVVPRPDRVERSATVAVFKDGKPVTTLKPGFAFYPDFNMSATRAGIRSNPVEDFYVIASEFSDDGRAIFRVHINPLVWWMWVAGPIFLLGTAVSLWPERRRTVVSISELKAMAASAPRGES